MSGLARSLQDARFSLPIKQRLPQEHIQDALHTQGGAD